MYNIYFKITYEIKNVMYISCDKKCDLSACALWCSMIILTVHRCISHCYNRLKRV